MSIYRSMEPEMSDEKRAAFEALIEQAMMTGFLTISANKDKIHGAYTGAIGQPAGDLLRVALDGAASEFIGLRAGLIYDVIGGEDA